MADATRGDAVGQFPDLLTLAIITLIPGLLIHLFIIVNNVNDWWKGRSVTSADHIVTSLVISRMCAQCAFTTSVFLVLFLQKSQSSDVIFFIFTFAFCFFTYANLWLTSLLSVVFCLKISTLRTRLFLYLRRVMLPRTGHFIVASGLLSAVSCFMPLGKDITGMTNGGAYNTTTDNHLTHGSYVNVMYYFIIGASIPIIFYFFSSVLLFSSLYIHTVKMKRSSNLSINLEIYYSAMKFVSFTFIYNIIYFLCLFACAFYFYLYLMSLIYFQIVFGFLPVLHSSFLIYRTSRLRSQMSKVLQNVFTLLSPIKSTEIRENIELVAH